MSEAVCTSSSNAQATASKPNTVTRDFAAEFYFTDLYLLVENRMFKVIRRTFENDSEVFSDMFLLPTGEAGRQAEGGDPEHPIRLEGVQENEMIQLLRVLYPMYHGVTESLTCAQWADVLRLSTMWSFARVRALAMEKLLALTDPITKLRMWNEPKYHLDAKTWLIPAARAFTERKEGLTMEEAVMLSMEHVLRLCAVREKLASLRYHDRETRDKVIMEAYGVFETSP